MNKPNYNNLVPDDLWTRAEIRFHSKDKLVQITKEFKREEYATFDLGLSAAKQWITKNLKSSVFDWTIDSYEDGVVNELLTGH
jgi:hypothetical protein